MLGRRDALKEPAGVQTSRFSQIAGRTKTNAFLITR